MLLFIQLYAILFYLAIGNASLMLFNKLTYLLKKKVKKNSKKLTC